MSRKVAEWVGKTDDSMPPARVRLRILRRYDHKDYITGLPIVDGTPWTPDHIIALCNGGKNIESNLAPVIRGKTHKEKTESDLKTRAKIDANSKAAFGLKPETKRPIQSAGFPKKVRNTDKLPMLPPRGLYETIEEPR